MNQGAEAFEAQAESADKAGDSMGHAKDETDLFAGSQDEAASALSRTGKEVSAVEERMRSLITTSEEVAAAVKSAFSGTADSVQPLLDALDKVITKAREAARALDAVEGRPEAA